MLECVTNDLHDYQGHAILVFLGDLIDRGPDSAGVIDMLLHTPLPGDEKYVVKGNHEEAFLEAFDGLPSIDDWLNYGGLETLHSYGIDTLPGQSVHRLMHDVIPGDHVAFLRTLPDHVKIGDYLFVHAGICPGVPLDQQSSSDLRWIRADFLGSDVDHGMIVVHGHTIAPQPQCQTNRIGIDTGCYAGGQLTALVLEGSERRFLQVPGLQS